MLWGHALQETRQKKNAQEAGEVERRMDKT